MIALVLVLDVLVLLVIYLDAAFTLITLVIGGASLLLAIVSEWMEPVGQTGSKMGLLSWDTTRDDLLPSGSMCLGLLYVLFIVGTGIIYSRDDLSQAWFWGAPVAFFVMWAAGVAIGRDHTIRKRTSGVVNGPGSATELGTERAPE